VRKATAQQFMVNMLAVWRKQRRQLRKRRKTATATPNWQTERHDGDRYGDHRRDLCDPAIAMG